jgi:hypothetical protein
MRLRKPRSVSIVRSPASTSTTMVPVRPLQGARIDADAVESATARPRRGRCRPAEKRSGRPRRRANAATFAALPPRHGSAGRGVRSRTGSARNHTTFRPGHRWAEHRQERRASARRRQDVGTDRAPRLLAGRRWPGLAAPAIETPSRGRRFVGFRCRAGRRRSRCGNQDPPGIGAGSLVREVGTTASAGTGAAGGGSRATGGGGCGRSGSAVTDGAGVVASARPGPSRHRPQERSKLGAAAASCSSRRRARLCGRGLEGLAVALSSDLGRPVAGFGKDLAARLRASVIVCSAVFCAARRMSLSDSSSASVALMATIGAIGGAGGGGGGTSAMVGAGAGAADGAGAAAAAGCPKDNRTTSLVSRSISRLSSSTCRATSMR